MPETVLETVGLTKHYSGIVAVSGVSFAIRAGEILGYLGPNGSGKSTTVKMVTGLLEPSQGRVLFRGHDIRDDLRAYKHQLGYIPEEANLYGFLTGWEYLELVANLRGLPDQLAARRAKALLNGFSLYPHRDVAISSYSKGMRQRILIIAALLHDPLLVVLDEPFSGLDVTSALILRRVMHLLAASGKAILFSSHVLEVVEKLCSKILVLRKGTVVGYGTVGELGAGARQPGLENAFMHLTEQVDVEQVAADIVGAIA